MEGFPFQVEVVKTDRKRSASIRLLGDLVKVSVPMTLSDNHIRDLIIKQTPWIKNKLQEQSERRRSPLLKEYVSDEAITYLGKNYRLKVLIGEAPSIKLWRGYLEVTTTETLTKTFRLEASSEEEAWEIAEADLYAEGIELMDMFTEAEEVEEVNEVED